MDRYRLWPIGCTVHHQGRILPLQRGRLPTLPRGRAGKLRVAGRSANLLSAFFGLDNSLPIKANRICLGTTGLDGMPVIFSTEIDHDTLQAGDFRVTKDSGAVLQSGLSK